MVTGCHSYHLPGSEGGLSIARSGDMCVLNGGRGQNLSIAAKDSLRLIKHGFQRMIRLGLSGTFW